MFFIAGFLIGWLFREGFACFIGFPFGWLSLAGGFSVCLFLTFLSNSL